MAIGQLPDMSTVANNLFLDLMFFDGVSSWVDTGTASLSFGSSGYITSSPRTIKFIAPTVCSQKIAVIINFEPFVSAYLHSATFPPR